MIYRSPLGSSGRRAKELDTIRELRTNGGSSGIAKTSECEIQTVRILGTDVLERALQRHTDLGAPIAAWLTAASAAKWKNLNELRQTWRNTDNVKGRTIFNIKGNRYRLLAIVNYASQTLFVKDLVTHAEYTKKEGWNR
jgi:mRNA interferase HigB